MGLVVSTGNTGLASSEPGTGSVQVFSMFSMDLRVELSTKAYACMNVLYRFRPR